MIKGITALLLLILSVGFSQQMFNKQSMIVEDGLQTEWYKNGKKKAEGNFKDGKVFFLLI